MAVKYGGAYLGAKDPFVVALALSAALCDFCKDGLQICAGLGYDGRLEGYAVVFVVAGQVSQWRQ